MLSIQLTSSFFSRLLVRINPFARLQQEPCTHSLVGDCYLVIIKFFSLQVTNRICRLFALTEDKCSLSSQQHRSNMTLWPLIKKYCETRQNSMKCFGYHLQFIQVHHFENASYFCLKQSYVLNLICFFGSFTIFHFFIFFPFIFFSFLFPFLSFFFFFIHVLYCSFSLSYSFFPYFLLIWLFMKIRKCRC